MTKVLERAEHISDDILEYLSESLADYFSPVTYIPHVKKGIETLAKGGKKVLPKKIYDIVGEPEMGKGGWQKPGVLQTIAGMMHPEVHRALLKKGSYMGAAQGVLGGGLGGGSLGAFIGRSIGSGRPISGGGTGKAKAAKMIWNLAKRVGGRLGAMALGAGAGTALGAGAGGVAGALHGRAAGSAILGGGAAMAPIALGGALMPWKLPVTPVIPLAAAGVGSLGAGLGSDIMKKVWQIRGQAAQGGPTDTFWSQSPVARRTGK